MLADPHRLLAGELNLEVPELDQSRVTSFLEATDPNSNRIDFHERAYQRSYSRPYPWSRRVICRQGHWTSEFVELFPDLVELIRAFPVDHSLAFHILIDQVEQPGYDFTFHFDCEYPYGFRVLFGLDTDRPFLEFSRMKTPLMQDGFQIIGRPVITSSMLEPLVVPFTPLKSNTVLLINGSLAPHRVPLNNPTRRRTALLIQGPMLPSTLNFTQTLV